MERDDFSTGAGTPGGAGNTGNTAGAGGAGAAGGSGGYGGTSGAGSTGSTGTGGYGNAGDTLGSEGYGATAPQGDKLSSGLGGTAATSPADSSTFDRSVGGTTGTREKLADMGSTAREKLADVGSTVRDKAGNVKSSLADALETGADKLRSRTHTVDALDAGGGAALAIDSTTGTAAPADKLAGGMQATADWLRENDLDSLRVGIEKQVKENPGRSMVIAVGLGYLLGKALRR